MIFHFVIVLFAFLWLQTPPATAWPIDQLFAAQSQDEKSQVEDIESLILDLDESNDDATRRIIIAEIKSQGAKALRGLENPPKGLSRQTKLLVLKLKNEIEQILDRQAVQPSIFSLTGEMTLQTALKKIESQSGINLVLKNPKNDSFNLDLKDQEFWQGLDKLLDLCGHDVYRFSKPGTIEIIPAGNDAKRTRHVAYSGLARIEATNYFSSVDLKGGQSFDRIWLDIRWEPRIQPYELIMDYSSVVVVDEDGAEHRSLSTEPVEMSISKSEAGKQIDIRFDRIPRTCSAIRSIQGKTVLMAPVGRRKFRFEDIAVEDKASQRIGETTVTLKSATWSDSALKIAIEFQLLNPGKSLESHRGWMFRNKAYLLGKKSNEIMPTKTMTTAQEKDKMGFMFVFDNIDGPEGFDFVYESPTSIRQIPLEWKLGKIELK